MSGFNLHDHHQQHKERREERREARHERHERGGHDDDDDGRQRYRHQDDDNDRRPQSYQQGEYGYTAPPGPPRAVRDQAAFASQGGLDRGDFASDADIDRLVASGKFNERQGQGYEHGGAGGERYGRYDAPPGPPSGQGYGGRGNEYDRYDAPTGPPPGQGYGGRYDAPQGPPPGRGHQDQQPREDYRSGSGGYGGVPDRQNQYGSQQPQGRPQYDSPQAPQSGYGRGQDNTPSGGFGTSRDEGDQYRSGYGGPRGDRDEPPRQSGGYGGVPDRQNQYGSQQPQGRPRDSLQVPQSGYGRGQDNTPSGGFGTSRGEGDQYRSGYGGPRSDRDEPPRRGEAASYYNQQGPSGIAQERGDDNPEAYRRATQGLQDRIQGQRRPNDEDEYRAHVDAHRKAYGDDDHGPMDTDAIGSAAALEAFKQTTSNAPVGAFKTGGSSSKPERVAQEEEGEDTAAARAGGSGGLQDKLMGLAMSHAGKLFDKKNAGKGGDQTQDKAQAMQSAAATAMQLFSKYQSGKLDASDMSTVMSLAGKML